jgi:hypothetical protein
MKKYLYVALLVLFAGNALATPPKNYVNTVPTPGWFPLTAQGKSVPFYISPDDYPGVIRAFKDLQTDVEAVTHVKPNLSQSANYQPSKQMVIAGTIGKSALIDKLVEDHKLNVKNITGKWENFLVETIKNPLPGVDEALVIAGSDKRGTIYGIYDLSAQIGVSPWYYWADVPVKQHQALYVMPGRHTDGTPAVKYRGIFINDEAPAFSGWAKEKFGGVNHLVYQKMFELILRLKGNYLWPAMWGNAFNDDDKLDPVLADEYGIVMGTSHHEPMDRAQQEWKRYGKGDWNYETNAAVLQDFWRTGIRNMGTKETVVTVGMRGDGDMAMTEGSNVALLEKIVHDQRDILAEETKKPASETPQLWALYKEVQDYYDKGMRVPDDVTLLLCDDNWGNIRKLPKTTDAKRGGGYGIYYHFDYVGGPRNYKWLNTNPIPKVWEQMHLANEYGANQIWIVNVGDLKPMEFPIEFFLDYAWSPKTWPASSLNQYTKLWATNVFGPQYAGDIADIINKYTQYNGRRKPEMLDQRTYSLTNYNEFENIVNDYNVIKNRAEAIYQKMPANYKDAFFELVLHPVQACANLNELYYTVAKNNWYAKQGRAATNNMAAKAAELFSHDAEISAAYNNIANGKWNHMMDQTHIGYTYWQQPPVNKMPEVKKIDVPAAADMGVAIPGSVSWWPMEQSPAILPELNAKHGGQSYVEVFNRGAAPFSFTTKSSPYLVITPSSGKIDEQQRLVVSIDRAKVPSGSTQGSITITASNGNSVTVQVPVNNLMDNAAKGYTENDGYVAIEAPHFSRAFNTGQVTFKVLPDYGRTLAGVTTSPVTAPLQTLSSKSPHLEYQVYLDKPGDFKLSTYVSPSLDFNNMGGLKFAVSIDDETPQVMNLQGDKSPRAWDNSVSDNIIQLKSEHHIKSAGQHTIKYWMISSGVVLQKLVLDGGGLKPSYLGPPESAQTKN